MQATAPATHRSEKLPDTAEYDEDRDCLDAWEQSLRQRLNMNHNQYLTDCKKIAYAESQLIIEKKAHNLMGQYWVKGLCTLLSFEEYLQELRCLCGNPFKAEDAHTYLHNTHKQGSMSFAKYYHLFSQKKECFWMDNASLIDCLKRNVNYATQLTAFSWWGSDGKQPSTFYEYVQAFTETDEELQQLKHWQPCLSVHNAASLKSKSFMTSPSNPMGSKPVPVTSVAPSIPAVRGEPMDLSSAMAAV